MTSDHATPPPETLLAHREWVRSLARRLTDNAVDADDLEQDAWLAAASARPRDGVGIRAWFAKVMRNRAAERHRLDSNRVTREAVVARQIGLRSGAALVVDAEAHTRVVQAVLALNEPYRETVLLRFYEGLPPREVAAQMGVPVDTVKTRLRRAAEMLRDALGSRREDWLGAIAPLLVARHDAPGTATVVAGGLAMKATTKAAIAAALLLVAATVVMWIVPRDAGNADGTSPRELGVSSESPSTRARSPGGRRRAGQPDLSPGDQDATAETAPTNPAVSAPRQVVPGRVLGRILLPDGSPAVGAAVGGPGTAGWTAADADGRYSVAVRPREDGAAQPLWVVLPGFRPAGVGMFEITEGADRAASDVRLVADGSLVVRGRVVSRASKAISAGEVSASVITDQSIMDAARRSLEPAPLLMLGAFWSGREPPAAIAQYRASTTATIGDDGSFELRLPESLGVVVLVPKCPGHVNRWTESRAVREWASREVEIALDPVLAIRGRVVDGITGAPIEGAVLSQNGVECAKSDASGAFEAAPAAEAPRIEVTAPGFFARDISSPADGSAVVVKLHRRKTLAGVVRFEDGRTVAHASVAIGHSATARDVSRRFAETDDRGRFVFDEASDGAFPVIVQATQTSASFLPRVFEDIAGGREDLELVVEPALSVSGRVVDGDGRPVPRIHVNSRNRANDAAAQRSQLVVSSVSRDDGSFVVTGLQAGRVTLDVYDFWYEAGGYLSQTLQGVEAGRSDLVVVVRKGLTISGRVRDEDGHAAAGYGVGAATAGGNPFLGGAGGWNADLDADGRFVLRGLEPGRYRLSLQQKFSNECSWPAGGESVEAGAKDVVVTIGPGGSIAGVIVDASGTPVAGEWVTALWDPTDASGTNVRTDEKGRFEFRGLPLNHAYAVKARGALVRDVALGAREVRLEVPPAQR